MSLPVASCDEHGGSVWWATGVPVVQGSEKRMTNRWADADFLSQRGRPDRGAPSWKRIAMVVAGALLLAVVAVWSSCGEDEEERVVEDDGISEAVEEASQAVKNAVQAANRFAESEEAEALLEVRRQEQARHAHWEDGRAMSIAGELQPDHSVYVSMVNRGIPEGRVHWVISAMDEEFDFRRSRPGDLWQAEVSEEGRVEEFRYETSPENIWVARYDEEETTYEVEKLEIIPEIRTRSVAGSVEGSFWLTVESMGESGVLAHRFMKVFEYTIDFSTESRNGDVFAMVFEELYLDGEFLRYGRVLGAKYVGERGNRQAYLHVSKSEDEDEDAEYGYFDEEGENLERQFLRSPLDVTRVTSTFGRRQHPITGDNRMHNGVDYGAPTGTPVRAVASGEVVFAGWAGGYGKLLRIRHSGGYETRYAHLSRFERGISPGARVSQGQVVAQSGNTGASTAPHLHYEMLRNGAHIDPLTVEATSGDPLRGEEREKFLQENVTPLSEKLNEAVAREVPDFVAAIEEAEAASEEDTD